MQTTDLVASHKRVSIYVCSLASSSGYKWEAREDDQGRDAGKGLTTMRLLLAESHRAHAIIWRESAEYPCLVSSFCSSEVLCTKESWYIPKTIYTHSSSNDLWKTKFSFLAYSRTWKLNIPQKFSFCGGGGSLIIFPGILTSEMIYIQKSHCYTRRWRGEKRRKTR